MTYTQALDFLYAQLPMFQRVGATAYKPGLDNTYALARAVGNPHVGLKCIHVAGTNGKGSTSHMLASVFQELGWKTGLYTSPHLKDYRERIKINGKPLSKTYVARFIEKYRTHILEIQPSFFELTCVMALAYFAEKGTDMAIIETGMGGRLDSTNIVLPDLSIITNISKDHVQFLGNTLEKIAGEKAGIIKPGVPLVVGECTPVTRKVFLKKAKQCDAPVFFADQDFLPGIKSELKGTYQPKNIRTVLKAIEVLNASGYNIPPATVKKGIARVVTNTGIQGRWQVLSKKPLVIADIAHNEAGINEVLKNLQTMHYKNLHILTGVVNDKDVNKMLSLLPEKARYYFTNANVPRALPAGELEAQASKKGLKGDVFPTVKKALEAAKKQASHSDLILVTGSAFVVAEVV